MRVRILVDFWNLQIAWNKFHEERGDGRPPIPWDTRLPDVLTRRASGKGVYHGCHVYASIDPRNPADAGLRRFLHAMNGFPGYRVTTKERKSRGFYSCPHPECRRRLTECPHCGRELRRTVEKGVDTALVTDLIQAAIDDLLGVPPLFRLELRGQLPQGCRQRQRFSRQRERSATAAARSCSPVKAGSHSR